MPSAPVDIRQERLLRSGEDPETDSSIRMSRFQYIGCFQHPMSITTSALLGYYRDPNSCVEECRGQDIYDGVSSSELVVAVHNDPNQGRCGCALKSEIADFMEEDEGAGICTYRCRDFLNPYCGGPPDWWGLFIEYDQRSMSAQGAYDPWRYVWYTLVTIKERTIAGRYPEEGVPPERYYLNAVDTVTGKSRYEFHTRIKGGILYGLQYDIDSTRLVSLYTSDMVGRLRGDMEWQYRLCVIFINTTNQFRPYMQLNLAPLDITEPREAMGASSLVSPFYMGYSGASAIFSKDTNCYVFTQAQWAANKPQMKDRVYVVRIPDGLILREEPLDFKVTALYSNEQYGDLSAIGPRMEPQLMMPQMTYVYLARIYRSQIDSGVGPGTVTLVDWQYNPINPNKLVDPSIISDWQVYPGIASSDHLFNKSAIMFRYKTDEHPWGVMTVGEVEVRDNLLTTWCNSGENGTCQGSLNYDVPYAAVFNREPGIPLTLKAPSFVIPARFNMDASAINVKFDRSTLQGARQIDLNGDFLPDEIDYELQREGPFDCGELFNLETTWKLGTYPATHCLWMSNSEVRINLGYVNISVGESIFILPDALYSVNVGNEWSPAATGGVQLGLPDPLEAPVIIPSGSVKIDQCTPVRLDVDSLLDGGLPTWRWSLVESVEGSPNPEDLAAREGFTFDPVKLQTLQDNLDRATAESNRTLIMPSQLLEEASRYLLEASVTSRWNLTTNYTFAIEKLAFPAPTVYIEGPRSIFKNRTQTLQLVAVGEPSECADEDTVLAYRWMMTGQSEAPLGIPLNLADYPDVQTTSNLLLLPPYILEPSPENEYNEYNFTVECYVDTEFGNVADRTASATVTVRVRKSSVLLQMSLYDRLATITDILVMDARSSIDPDFPPETEGLTFEGTFQFRCLTPEPERAPCFDVRRLTQEARRLMTSDGFIRAPGAPPGWSQSNASSSGTGVVPRRLQATDGFLTSDNMRPCRQDIGTLLYDGGNTYFYPLFDGIEYCEYARGVLMVDTADFLPGIYKWTVRATHFDGRTAERDIFIEMVMEQVPRIRLSFASAPPNGKFPVTSEIRIRGNEEGEPSDAPRTYSWNILVYERNPAYSQEEALAALNDPENPYTIDEFIYADKTGTTYSIEDPALFESNTNSPNIVIKKGTLRPSTKYKMRLNVHLASVTGYSSIDIETAGLAPRNGRLEVNPLIGSFADARVLTAPDWNADDSPLTYEFGFFEFPGGSDVPTLQAFSAAPSQVKSLSISSLPLGAFDEATGNYTVSLFVKVCTPFDACTVEPQVVFSNPPDDPAGAAADLLDDIEDQSDSEQLNTFGSVLSVAGSNTSIQNAVLDGLESTPMSADASAAGRRAQLLETMVSGGANGDISTSERVMSALENLVIVSADNNLFNQNEAIAAAALSAMGGLMPGAAGSGLGATGQSVRMGAQRTPSLLNQAVTLGGQPQEPFNTTIANRQRTNHPMPIDPADLQVEECPTSFCDRIGLWCIMGKTAATIQAYRCCNAINYKTLCDDPPCWFKGNTCPLVSSSSAISGASVSSGSSALSGERRLQGEEYIDFVGSSIGPWGGPGGASRGGPAGSLGRNGRRPSAASRRASVASGAGVSTTTVRPTLDQTNLREARLASPRGESWFDSWVDYNFPLGAPDESEVSEYNRVRGYHGWHPDIRKRRLEFMSVNETISAAQRLQALEDAEQPLVREAQVEVAEKAASEFSTVHAAAEQQVIFDAMSPEIASRLKAENQAIERAAQLNKVESDRNSSQRITRIIVMRDTVAKSLISDMLPNEQPRSFVSTTFRLTIGKTPDLTSVHPHFEFPEPYFKRPADSPDEPTALRPLTGFSYIYVEYFSNVYSWSDSNPPSSEFAMVTLLALQANTKDLEVRTINPPIKVFKQYDLYSNAMCLFWDRFAPDTAGGQWSTSGVVNDGDSCLTSHMADIAVFMDGRQPSGTGLVDAAAAWDREIWESHCIGCDTGSNLFPVTALGMILFTNLLLILLGYVQDERRRSDLKKNKTKSRYFYDGDGLKSALSVDDPIAYSLRDTNLVWFWIGTFTNIAVREHAIIGTVFYHETFTRPQRLMCFMSMVTGLLAINAAIHSHPGYVQQAREYVISGVLSGLFVFPIYCGLILMFNMRPSQVKKRLIKRTYSTIELDLINKQRQKLADQTSLRPPDGYMKRPPLPSGGVGSTTLLSLPAPLPLPPLPPGAAGRPGMMGLAALPPPPPPGSGLGGMASTGMLALPALPGMTGTMGLPPPPKYPPPPGNAKGPSPAALMPPLVWNKAGQPPPTPFPALQGGDAGGTLTNLPIVGSRPPLTPPDTGATPLQLADFHHGGAPPGAGVGFLDAEAASPMRAMVKEDMSHGMAPPADLPGAMPSPQGVPGAITPPTPATPKSAMGASSAMVPGPPSGSASFRSSVMGPGPPLGATMLPYDAVPPPIFVRGGPPTMQPAPHAPGPLGPGGLAVFGGPPGRMPPGFAPPVPSAFPGAGGAGLPMAPLPMGLPPAPPPPPREDDSAFVRRAKLVYMDKVTKEHDRHDLLEDHEALGKDIPFWVFDTMTLMPYLASCSWTLVCIFVVLQYGVKFMAWQEEFWLKGSLVGLFMNVVLLELFRIIMTTLVELRKFENRRKAKAGHFLPRRVKREGEDFQAAPLPKLWQRAMVPPQVPKPKNPPPRPKHLPMPGAPPRPPNAYGQALGLPGPPPGSGGARIPVAPPPPRPPIFSAASMVRAGGFDEPLAPATPKSVFSQTQNSRTGYDSMPPAPMGMSGTSTPNGQGRGPPPGPRLASAAELAGGGGGGNRSGPPTPGRGPPSPAHSTHSLGSLAQSSFAHSLHQQVKAGRHAEAPPPPPAQPGAVPTQGATPPPAPAAPPPSYSRPPSRPCSALSSGGQRGAAPPPPPRP